jgi:hypothetical protein
MHSETIHGLQWIAVELVAILTLLEKPNAVAMMKMWRQSLFMVTRPENDTKSTPK